MSHDRNIVRDRTLVLRVLVPGLHTSLNDKINAKKDGGDDLPTPMSSSSAAHQHQSSSSTTRMSGDQLLDLDGVTCMPSSVGSNLWHFRCDGATYPARLVNVPCPLEVLKTHDHANYHKSADIGQMLIVYEDEYAMQEAENEKGYKVDGFPSYYHSGLTPPMSGVVKRRFLSRFEERETKPVPPPKAEVTEVENELQDLITRFSGGKGGKGGKGKGKGKGKKKQSASSSGKDNKMAEEIEEEIVDYEPWMAEGKKFTIDDAKLHPEWWLSKAEMKEIDLVKREQAQIEDEKRRKEQEAAAKAEAQRRAEDEKIYAEKAKKAEKKKEKKKKKDREKKRQQKEQDDDAAAAAALAEAVGGGDGKKKGIASLKKRTENMQAAAAVEPMDDITAVAMAIDGGDAVDEDFLLEGGDMFDFDNDDILDL